MKTKYLAALAAVAMLALSRAEAVMTVNINDDKFDVQWLLDGGSAQTSLTSTNTTLGCWDYSFSIAPSDPGCSTFYGTVNYLASEIIERNVFSGVVLWGTQVYDWSDRYASGESMRRLTTYAVSASGSGAIVLHVARTAAPAGVPDAGSPLALFAGALLLVGGLHVHGFGVKAA